jgi:hypothetical protein
MESGEFIAYLVALIVGLGIQAVVIKSAVFGALEKHARNMAIRRGTFEDEGW